MISAENKHLKAKMLESDSEITQLKSKVVEADNELTEKSLAHDMLAEERAEADEIANNLKE